MKLIYPIYFTLILLPNLSLSQVLYDDFETPSGIRYQGTGLFKDTINPLSKGLNISEKVAKYVKKGNVKDIINVKVNRNISDVSPYANSKKKMYMFFYSYGPGMEVNIAFLDSTKVRRKKINSGIHSEYHAITRRNNQWEVIYFDFVSAPDPNISPLKINKVLISIEPRKTTSSVYYFDDLYGPEFIGGGPLDTH
jgi:hypothetical protein